MTRFGQLFNRRPRSFMGVDISASRIRLLELDGRGDTHRVLSYASEPLPAEAIANEQIVDA